jgi:pimeloyl-ACP methyl ester carboxylesterase
VGRVTSFDGTGIAYEVSGTGPVVVLLHGWASDAKANWRETGVAGALEAAGFTGVLPDARGHGRSDKPHDPAAYRPPANARDVVAVLDDLGVASADLVGYSMGSTTAISVAPLEPQRVRRLVLGGAGATLLQAGTEPFHRARAENAATLEADEAHGPLRRYVDRVGADRLAMAAALRGEDGIGEAELAIRQPTLVVAGRDDTSSGPPEALAERLVHGEALRIEGDHLTAVRSPDFVRATIEFLSRT